MGTVGDELAIDHHLLGVHNFSGNNDGVMILLLCIACWVGIIVMVKDFYTWIRMFDWRVLTMWLN